MRTDVTFEITSTESNDTKTIDEKEIGKDDDNASIPLVPVFKGKPDRGGNKLGAKDPKTDKNFHDIWSVRPLDNPFPPVGQNFYHSYDDRNRQGINSGWQPSPQYEIWTTERNNHRKHDIPVYHHQGETFIRHSFFEKLTQKLFFEKLFQDSMISIRGLHQTLFPFTSILIGLHLVTAKKEGQ